MLVGVRRTWKIQLIFEEYSEFKCNESESKARAFFFLAIMS